MSIIVKSLSGESVSLPNSLDDRGISIFNQVIKQGKVVGSCYGHGICGGCRFKHKPEDKDKFQDLRQPDIDLPADTKLACCSTVKHEHSESVDIEVELTRQRYMR